MIKNMLAKVSSFWKKSIKQNTLQIRNEYIYWELRWKQSIRAALAKMFFSSNEEPTPIEHTLLCTNSRNASLIALEDGKSFITKES